MTACCVCEVDLRCRLLLGIIDLMTSSETQSEPVVKKPWYQKFWIWAIVAVLLVVGGIGNALGAGTELPEASPTVTVPDVTNQDGATARDALAELEFIVEFDAGDEIVIMASNWNVDSQSPAAGSEVSPETTVVLSVSKPEVVQEPQSNELDEVTAAQFLAMGWEQRFLYGGDVHWIADRIAIANEDGSWTFKIGVTLENAYGNEYGGTIEGDVGGTRDAPTIVDSILYTDTGEIINYYE